MVRSIILICFISFISLFNSGFGQDSKTGEARFLVEVDNGYFEILVNDTMLLKIYKCNLPVGKHSAKIWSPGYIQNVVDFQVFEDSITQVHVNMAVSNERKQFEADYKDYRMKFHKSFTVPGSISLGFALATGTMMIRGYGLKQTILDHVDSYHLSGSYSDAVFYRDEIERNNVKYNRTRIWYYSLLGLTAASIGTTIYTFKKFKKNNPEPKLNSESPFKDKFSLQITPFGCRMIIPIG